MANNTNDQKTKLYLINASIIVAGNMTIVQSTGIKHPRIPFQWGAGTLSVMGVSFTTVPSASYRPASSISCCLLLRFSRAALSTSRPAVAQIAVPLLMAAYPPLEAGECGTNYGYFTSASSGPKGHQTGSLAGGSPCSDNPAGFHPYGTFPGAPVCVPNCQSEAFDYAWGKMLGTLCFCALIPMFISGLNFRLIKKLFPPIVIGPVIMLIGIALIGVGFGDWGGGTFCAQRVIYNGFSNNLMSAVVTNDGDYGFSSTDGVSSSQIRDGTGGNGLDAAGFGRHNVHVPLNSFELEGVQAAPGYSLANATATFSVSNLAADYPSGMGTTTFGNYTTFSKSGTGLQFTNFACNGAGSACSALHNPCCLLARSHALPVSRRGERRVRRQPVRGPWLPDVRHHHGCRSVWQPLPAQLLVRHRPAVELRRRHLVHARRREVRDPGPDGAGAGHHLPVDAGQQHRA